MSHERKSTNVRAAEALEKIAISLEFQIWMQYAIHVDRMERTPSKFLEEGFTNFMQRGKMPEGKGNGDASRE